MGCAYFAGGVVCGGNAIRACVGCGRLSTRLCDFKLRSGWPSWRGRETCDAPICAECSTRLPGDKDACPMHAELCLEACQRKGLEVPA